MNKTSFLTTIKDKIDNAKVVCFGVWDTLFLRPYVKPTDTFKHMQYHFSAEGFELSRTRAEECARMHHPEWPDITLEEIYRFMPEHFKKYEQIEMDFEAHTIAPNQDMKEVWDYALKNKKTIYILTDMYLPLDWFKENLDRLGFKGYKDIFLSCHFYDGKMRPKYNGRMYRFVAKKENFCPSEALMIGDNYVSDYKQAIKAGFKAVYYPKPTETFFQSNPRFFSFYIKNKDSVLASIFCALASTRLSSNSSWKDIGFLFGGMAAFSFMTWLDRQATKDGIQDMLFIARDGYSLKRVFDIIKTSSINSHYTYACRLQSLTVTLDYAERLRDNNEAGRATRTILEYFRDKNDFLSHNTPTHYNHVEAHNFITKHSKIYTELAVKEANEYSVYISKVQDMGKIAICDTMTSFFAAQKLLEKTLGRKIPAYYEYCSDAFIKHPNRYFNFCCQANFSPDFSLIPLKEFFFSAPEPPVCSIRNTEPVHKNASPEEQQRINIYPFVSEGIVEFASTIKKRLKGLEIPNDFLASEALLRVLQEKPSEEEIKLFTAIKHSESADHNTYIPILKKPQKKKRKLVTTVRNQTRKKIQLLGGLTLLERYKTSDCKKWKLFGIITIYSVYKKNI